MEVMRTYEADRHRVILAFVPAEGWFVEIRDNDKCATECGPISEKKANAASDRMPALQGGIVEQP